MAGQQLGAPPRAPPLKRDFQERASTLEPARPVTPNRTELTLGVYRNVTS
jgi:hypothetical protein